jgi:hypothetical protein
MRRNANILIVLAATVIANIGCAPAQPQTGKVQASTKVTSTAPILQSVRPDSVVVPYGGVVEVTLYGTGFAPGKPGQNTVHFNGTALRKIAGSEDGRRIVFVIPDVISRSGEAPPSQLEAGSYRISVETPSGLSNAVTVRVYR